MDPVNSSVSKRGGLRKRDVSWEMVLATLEDEEAASVFFSKLRMLQIKPSETWSLTATKEAVAGALTAAEDWLEMNKKRLHPQRDKLKKIRRRIEQGLI